MSIFEFFVAIIFLNYISLILLIIISIREKSPRLFLKYFFGSVIVITWSAMIIQQTAEVSYISNRQILCNLLISIWGIKAIYLNKYLKIALFSGFLEEVKDNILDKNYLNILFSAFKLSLIQILCFSSIISLNFISASSGLTLLDAFALIVCVLGLTIELKSLSSLQSHLKKAFPAKASLLKEGLWKFSRHPHYLGQLLFFLGLFFFGLGTVNGLAGLVALIAVCYLFHVIIIPENEKKMSNKFDNYHQYTQSTYRTFTKRI
ncbi:MAG: hypothetical protein CMD53_03735 [Gammaproteobacteria bacterium]|nr:hypothetical protein [Gammaproteobacteria bacterium]